MPLVRVCAYPGCQTLTMGVLCAEHEPAQLGAARTQGGSGNRPGDGARLARLRPVAAPRRDARQVAAAVAEQPTGLDRSARIEAVREIARTDDPAALVMAWCLFYAGEPADDIDRQQLEDETLRLWTAMAGRDQEFLTRDAAYELFRSWTQRQRFVG